MDLKEKETKLQLESKIDAPKTEDKESEEEIQEKANQARIERKKRKKK